MLDRVVSHELVKKFLPKRWHSEVAVVPVIDLSGTIGSVGLHKSGLSLAGVRRVLEKAFSVRGAVAVALCINSPGGSPVQSRLIFKRIRDLAKEKNLPVYVFCEDVAASGGYMLALAGDEIYADPSSIIGSIGVVSASFGFEHLIEKIGVSRRLYTAGARKAPLDMFKPENEEDVKQLKTVLRDIHHVFIDIVRERRAGKLSDDAGDDIFSGLFWSGEKARSLGLIDGLGDMDTVLREKYGDHLLIRRLKGGDSFWLKRFFSRRSSGVADGFVELLGERVMWSRFGK